MVAPLGPQAAGRRTPESLQQAAPREVRAGGLQVARPVRAPRCCCCSASRPRSTSPRRRWGSGGWRGGRQRARRRWWAADCTCPGTTPSAAHAPSRCEGRKAAEDGGTGCFKYHQPCKILGTSISAAFSMLSGLGADRTPPGGKAASSLRAGFCKGAQQCRSRPFPQHVGSYQVASPSRTPPSARNPTPAPPSLRQHVYGAHSRIPFTRGGACGRQLLVMGPPRSGASRVARLLTLAGVWAGRPEQIAIASDNPLSGWERRDARALNAALAANFTAAGSFSPRALGGGAWGAFRAAAGAVVADMDQYCGSRVCRGPGKGGSGVIADSAGGDHSTAAPLARAGRAAPARCLARSAYALR
jgi:hypothetical protein